MKKIQELYFEPGCCFYSTTIQSECMNLVKKSSIFPALIFGLIFSSCQPGDKQDSEAKSDKKETAPSYPYRAIYSSDESMSSNNENLQTVLTIWKMFESNRIDEMRKFYADTVTYDDASGFRFHGKCDTLLNIARKDIEGLDSLRFDISQFQNLHINDRKEDWVYIWAAERRYQKNGKADTSLIHEQWKVENGKVTYFNQYKANLPK